ncbi:MAG TPA: hypothetical protein VFC19_26750 [Candidatus Limnocylindrales bacterium]|nr:hypothetical protein [Candidatus Limnocylindrales bacterium]
MATLSPAHGSDIAEWEIGYDRSLQTDLALLRKSRVFPALAEDVTKADLVTLDAVDERRTLPVYAVRAVKVVAGEAR